MSAACSSPPPASVSAIEAPREAAHDVEPGVEPPVKFDATPPELDPDPDPRVEARDRLRLLALSRDGRRALLGVIEPGARAPELRLVDVAAREVTARLELMSIAALPRPMWPDGRDPDFAARLDRAVHGNRMLAEELAAAGALLAELPSRGGTNLAAAGAAHVVYTDGAAITIARSGEVHTERIAGASDPQVAPDGATLIVRSAAGLRVVPIAGPIPAPIPETARLVPRTPSVALGRDTLRFVEIAEARACAVDVSLAQRRVVHRTCAPACGECTIALPALSPSGAWLAWTADAHVRAMNVATGVASVDAPLDLGVAGDAALAVSDRGRVHAEAGGVSWDVRAKTAHQLSTPVAMRDCTFREDALVCVRGDHVAVLELPR
ncbi:MAG: hypothetical protein KF773_07095 [Deltaproteobacteria bacterium]|nr:hypothetical protein [Deltaproteobacteria bacterium]